MFPHLRNPFDNRPSGNPDTAKFLGKLVGPEDEAAYRKAMGEQAPKTLDDSSAPELTHEELAYLKAIKDRESRVRELINLRKRQYLEWAEEFHIGGDDPQGWIADTFIFNPDGTVETQGDLNLLSKSLTRLPPNFTRVNGNLNLSDNRFTSIESLPQEIRGDLNLSSNRLSILALECLQGRKIDGDLRLIDVPATSLTGGIELGGEVYVQFSNTGLIRSVRKKGYKIREIG